MKLRLLLVTLCLAICAFNSSAQLYTFKNYNHRDGLTMAAITSIAQSKDGYLWIGTDGAPLMRFNGQKFEELLEKGGDNDHHTHNLIIEGDSILFASEYKGFYYYSIKNKTYHKFNVKTNVTGDAMAVLKSNSTHYFLGARKIYSELNGKTKILFSFDKKAKLHHYIKVKNGYIILTSEGNYLLRHGNITSLSNYLNVSSTKANQYNFGYIYSDRLILFSATGGQWLEAVINDKGNVEKSRVDSRPEISSNGDRIISFNSDNNSKKIIVITENGNLFHIRDRSLYPIAHNYNQQIMDPAQIICDLNGDYWICSKSEGIYKVSLEAFTKIQLHPIYELDNISVPYRTVYNDMFISNFSGKTYVGHFQETEFKEFAFQLKAVTQVDGQYYVATNIGIKKFIRSNDDPTFEDVYYTNENVNLIFADKMNLWAGVAGKGIVKINLKTGEKVEFRNKHNLPEYFYTAQLTTSGKEIYFGTNNGIFKFDKKTTKFSKVRLGTKLGSYSGCSTKDVYGTIWFTMEKGIVGFTSESKKIVLLGSKHFNTNLYYTLNADRLGNLIVGTNKGLTILQVTKLGAVVGQSHYNASSGFGGYETHMRSQFQEDNNIYVGTVEGLFLINTDILHQLRTPLSPMITDLTRYDTDGTSTNSFRYKFHVNNPKIGKIQYSYRLTGKEDSWISIQENDDLYLNNLDNGSYTLEVRASYDGIHFSKSSKFKFDVKLPVWETNWFIILIVICVIGVNIILINYSRAFEKQSLVKTKDTEVHLLMAPNIILLGIIAAGASYIVAPLISSELDLHLGLVLTMEFLLLGLYFLSKSVIGSANERLINPLLLVGVAIILLHGYIEMYISHLHPFHIIGLVLTTMVTPFFLHRIKSMIIFTSLLLMATMIMVVIIENEIYPKSYFIIANIALITILIFLSYLRSDSLDKLIFISSIVNRGNIPAIAFTDEGKIVYASENISNFIPATHNEVLNKDISILNNYVPFEGRFREVDVLKEFKDGEKYLVPMAGDEAKIRWIEWEYKDFSKDVKVMLGQDVSEKMELENTYELLVQNAEDFIYRCNLQGDFVFLNDICYEKLGYTKEDLLNKHSISIVPEDHIDEVTHYYAEHFKQKIASSYKEFPIRKKNGEIIWIGQYVTTLYAAGSSTLINGFIALARDITDIRQQQQLIKDQRDDITSSISYAQRIQVNLLPHERNFTSIFKEYFIIYKPKDIVSGDFYWMEKIESKTFLVLGDCTGHGVPGSFMTLLGINLLNSIILEGRMKDPGDILNEMDKRLVDVLPRGSGDTAINDGMEITLCVIDESSDEIAYGCAGSRFLIYEDVSFTMLKGDNKHIGDAPTPSFQGYSTHYTPFMPENQLYLFSDGFQDQFGGPNDKKFSFRRILELFELNVDLSLVKQRIEFEEDFNAWIASGEQTDDVTIIAIKKNEF
ncbi:MAG: PAS domain S-box protein [Crocinitomicaceae bacterium]|nr:PAS domain S-box protein [Crocinitomicaceae bacterium]